MKNFIGWGGIVLMCALVGASWGHAENQRKERSVVTKQDALQQLYQTVDFLDQRVDRVDRELTDLYRWAKVCEARIIKGEKREDQLERRVRKLEGRLYGP